MLLLGFILLKSNIILNNENSDKIIKYSNIVNIEKRNISGSSNKQHVLNLNLPPIKIVKKNLNNSKFFVWITNLI